jgi:hypothetical protein
LVILKEIGKKMSIRYLKKGLDAEKGKDNLMGDRIYKNAILIVPGIYQDSKSRLKIFYKSEVLEENASNWKSNYLNVDHGISILSRIGFVENPRWDNNSLKADLHILPITSVAKDTISLIDNGIANALSIEAMTDEYFDNRLSCLCLKNIEFLGAAVVTTPAVPEARIVDGSKN